MNSDLLLVMLLGLILALFASNGDAAKGLAILVCGLVVLGFLAVVLLIIVNLLRHAV